MDLDTSIRRAGRTTIAALVLALAALAGLALFATTDPTWDAARPASPAVHRAQA